MPIDPVWVVGSGGLLGKGVVAELRRRHIPVLTSSIPWDLPEAAVAELWKGAAALQAASRGGGWQIAWCAGAGVTGTTQAALDLELLVLRKALEGFAEILATSPEALGRIFLASSAGGVFAGSPNPPYTEQSPVAPLAPYGWAKLQAEETVSAFAKATGARAFIGRVSNLYGPGQNLNKAQGLLSVFAKANVTRQPVTIYVSLDTLRDYLYVEDAARLVVSGLNRLSESDVSPGETVVKILASQRADTIGSIIGACRTVFKRRPLVVLGASPHSKVQAMDLRMRSTVWPELDRHMVTPLTTGLDATARDIQHLLGNGSLHLL